MLVTNGSCFLIDFLDLVLRDVVEAVCVASDIVLGGLFCDVSTVSVSFLRCDDDTELVVPDFSAVGIGMPIVCKMAAKHF